MARPYDVYILRILREQSVATRSTVDTPSVASGIIHRYTSHGPAHAVAHGVLRCMLHMHGE